MTRPRKTTSRYCITCRRSVFTSAAERETVVLHRMEHRRLDRRRAQWRRQKARLRVRDGRVGALHALSCQMPRRCSCKPIPVYRREDVVA